MLVLNHTQHAAENFSEYKISDTEYSYLKKIVNTLWSIAFKRYFNFHCFNIRWMLYLNSLFCSYLFTNYGSQSILPKPTTLVNKVILRHLPLIMHKFYFFNMLVIQWISKKNSLLRKQLRKLRGSFYTKLIHWVKMEA